MTLKGATKTPRRKAGFIQAPHYTYYIRRASEQTSPPGGACSRKHPAMGQTADRAVAAARSADFIFGPRLGGGV